MDKNFVIAILLMTLIIIAFSSPQYQKRFGKKLPEKPAVEQTESGSRRNALDDRARVRPERIDRPIPVTAPQVQADTLRSTLSEETIFQVNVPSSEEDFSLENETVQIIFSPRGCVITNAVLKNFTAKGSGSTVQLVTEGESWYDGFIRDGELVIYFSDLLFSKKSLSREYAVYEAELSGNRIITKEFSIHPNGYVLNAKTNLSGSWNDPQLNFSWHGPINETETPFKSLKIWPFSMLMRDEQAIYKNTVYLGQGERKTIALNGKEKKPRAIYSKEAQKLDAKKEGAGSDIFIGDLDWYALRSKYFIAAIVPDEKMRWEAFSQFSNNGSKKWFDFTLAKNVSAGNTDIELYIGPISYDMLKGYGHNLTEAMELSFIRFIRPLSILFLWLFKKLHTFISNWGIVIIVFSIIIKIALFPLSKKSFDSMHKMSELQPQINILREKFKNNQQGLQKATMELYKKEGVNPLGGCLPTLFQMPVFFALYPVVGRAFELRQAMFIPHWIEDLSRPDPFYILPVAMGVSMFFQMRKTSKDPNQKAMLYIMPVMMVIMFSNFSAGLTLYWFMFNIISLLQQKFHLSTKK
ncbi:MAG: membrane protein insertase YidC [Candidatus Latescibacteria bacterium]|jgi:YidC/Oxa1 family membrane protein insertase|nr:membrane protein insertase YidC [Candidatus Latescibacterota bacterium]